MSMSELLASLLVSALLIAVNPVPILVAVTLLTADHGKRDTAVFAVTLTVVMLIVGVLTIFFLGQAGSSSQRSGSTASAALQTLFGLAFLTMALIQWRAKPSEESKQPRWMTLMDKGGFGVAVVLGVSLTNYALLTTGSTTILKSGLPTNQQVAGLVFFIVVAVSTVVAPLIVLLVRHAWAERQLGRLRHWLTVHDRVLIIVVFGAMGALFTFQGVSGLLS